MYEESQGTITIATTVLNTIARLTTLSVPGVARMGNNGQLLQTNIGTNVKVIDNKVKADIFIVVRSDVNFYETGQRIQQEVTRSIKEIVGMDVQAINVYIQDVEYPLPEPSTSASE
ncbi:hypothetical protein TFLX_03327 [Thermoflexales bacterium]|nr:hypothetical protein TFLX_03327 [Thermoflexales bacterium]